MADDIQDLLDGVTERLITLILTGKIKGSLQQLGPTTQSSKVTLPNVFEVSDDDSDKQPDRAGFGVSARR